MKPVTSRICVPTQQTLAKRRSLRAAIIFLIITVKKYLPNNAISYSSKEGAQEAHEAIRPSNVTVLPTQLSGMERDAERLYTLIWQQFVACQMTPAEYTSTSIVIDAEGYELRARGRIIRFEGYLKAQPPFKKNDDDVVLPDIKVGDVVDLNKLEPKQHFTKPTARYTEASLVKELEKRGIGRPSTYASIISTIQDRGYVHVENRRFFAEKNGRYRHRTSGRKFQRFIKLQLYSEYGRITG